MYICLCKGVTESAIRQKVADGATTFREVRDELGVGTQCGKCACDARALIAEAAPEESPGGGGGPLFYDAGMALA